MLNQNIAITKDDIQGFTQKELDFIENNIRHDFMPYEEEMKGFNINNLIKYIIETNVITDTNGDNLLKSKKTKSRIIFNNNNETYDLVSKFKYI